MSKWSVMYAVDASVTVVVDAETEEEAIAKANGLVGRPSICNQCANEIEVGDVVDVLEVIEIK